MGKPRGQGGPGGELLGLASAHQPHLTGELPSCAGAPKAGRECPASPCSRTLEPGRRPGDTDGATGKTATLHTLRGGQVALAPHCAPPGPGDREDTRASLFHGGGMENGVEHGVAVPGKSDVESPSDPAIPLLGAAPWASRAGRPAAAHPYSWQQDPPQPRRGSNLRVHRWKGG